MQETRRHLETNPDFTDSMGKRYIRKGEKVIFSMFSNLGSLFNGGQYTFPFQFLLPQGLPSSFEYITNDVNCSIAYYGELRITRGDGSSVTQYKSFFVRQAVNSLNYSQEKIST